MRILEPSAEEVNAIIELGLCNGRQRSRRLDSRDMQATLYQWPGCDTRPGTDLEHPVSRAQSGRLNEVIKEIIGIPRPVAVVVESLGGEAL